MKYQLLMMLMFSNMLAMEQEQEPRPQNNPWYLVGIGDTEGVRKALDNGFNVNEKKVRGFAGSGETLLHVASERGHVDIARLLLKRGADMYATDLKEDVPFHRARSPEMAALFLDRGMPIDKQGFLNHTLLYNVSCGTKKNLVKFLVMRNASLFIPAQYGFTPLHAAAYYEERENAMILLWAAELQGKRDKLLDAKGLVQRAPGNIEMGITEITAEVTAAELTKDAELKALLNDKDRLDQEIEKVRQEVLRDHGIEDEVTFIRKRELGLATMHAPRYEPPCAIRRRSSLY